MKGRKLPFISNKGDKQIIVQTTPRNSPCPCGSGLKAKKCPCKEEQKKYYLKK